MAKLSSIDSPDFQSIPKENRKRIAEDVHKALKYLKELEFDEPSPALETRKTLRTTLLDSSFHIPELPGPFMTEEIRNASKAIFDAAGILVLTGAVKNPDFYFGPEGPVDSSDDSGTLKMKPKYHKKRTDIPEAMEETRQLVDKAIGHLKQFLTDFGDVE